MTVSSSRKQNFSPRLFWLILCFNHVRISSESQLKTVTTSFGKLQGRVTHLGIPGLGPVEEYLGIPYAAPPIGQKRFMLPNSVAKWSSVKDATRLPPVCIQMFPNSVATGAKEALKWMPESHYAYISRLRSYLRNQSEDCLYLNIYVPERKGTSPLIPLPVLVLIHGGSFSWGTGNAYNASVLASYGQIIVVTLNYRLGLFGFLSAGFQAPSCRGNWALGDIAAALEFLRQTIQDFGGDHNKMTLLGWDTGAALVNLLMSSPVSAPSNSRSFQRAILLGGSALSSWSLVSDPPEVFSYIAKGLACPPYNHKSSSAPPAARKLYSEDTGQWKPESQSFLQDMTDCIASSTVDNITRVARNIEPPTYLNVFGPNVDGSIVINYPRYTLEHYSDLFRGLDLMVGMTQSEAFHLLGQREVKEGMERTIRDKIYRTLVTNLFQYHRNEILTAVEDEYTDWQSPTMHQSGNIRKAVLQALSDGLYVAPAIKVARLHSRMKEPFRAQSGPVQDTDPSKSKAEGNRKGTTFVYLFSGHESKNAERGNLPESIHNEDLAYILGYPLFEHSQSEQQLFNRSFVPVDKALSEAMMRYISNFVKTGDPNRPAPFRNQFGDGGVAEKLTKLDWPQFEADIRESYVEIGDNPMRDSFYRAHEVAFWNKFLPSLEKAGQTESDERHHRFPTNSTYYGIVRPLQRYPAFPPPPLPPTPMPPALQAKLLEEKIRNQQLAGDGSSTGSPSTPGSEPVSQESYSTILSVTVAVGCALLTLNILIFAGIYHQWDKHKRFRKRTENHHGLHQQPFYDVGGIMPVQGISAAVLNSSTGGGSTSLSAPSVHQGQTYDLSAPLTRQPLNVGTVSSERMPPAPPPPTSVATSTSNAPVIPSNGLDNDLHPTLTSKTYNLHYLHPQQHTTQTQHQPLDTPGTPHGAYAEQEPLLNRSFVSPTCPRHGKQAAAAAAAAMAAMEEIQV